MHDALDSRPCLGLDRHHIATVAERDDRLLKGAAELRPDERVEPSSQAVVGDPDRRPEPAQPGRRRIEHLADGIEASGQRGAERRQRMQVATEVAQERPSVVGEDGAEPRGRIDRVGDLEEVGRIQPAAAHGALDRRTDVVSAADAHGRPFLQEGEGLVRLVQPACDDQRLVRRLQRLGKAP